MAKTFSVFPREDSSTTDSTIEQLEETVRDGTQTQQEINLELLKQIRLLNERIEEAFRTNINENDIKEHL